MNRRNFLLLGSAAGGLGLLGGGAAYVKVDNHHAWVSDILHRGLPGYALEPRGLSQFIDEYFAKATRKLKAFAAVEGLIDVKWALDSKRKNELEIEERKILSQFLLGSDFFANYPPGPKEITYLGVQKACASPFAQY
jgi:hypothetical protein